MATLHLVGGAAASASANAFERCLARVREGDVVVLMEAVGTIPAGEEPGSRIAAYPATFYRLAGATGGCGPATQGVTVIDYDRLVALTVKHHPVVSWF